MQTCGREVYHEVGTMSGAFAGARVYLGIVMGLLQNDSTEKGSALEKDLHYTKNMLFLFAKTTEGAFIAGNDFDNAFALSSGCDDGKNEAVYKQAQITYRCHLGFHAISSNYNDFIDKESGVKFWFARVTNRFFSDKDLYSVKNIVDDHILYANQNIQSNQKSIRSIINPIYVVRTPSGIAIDAYSGSDTREFVYKTPNPNSGYDGGVLIRWITGEMPSLLPKQPKDAAILSEEGNFSYSSEFNGCKDTMAFALSSAEGAIDVSKDLRQVATTDRGDILYELQEKSNTIDLLRNFP